MVYAVAAAYEGALRDERHTVFHHIPHTPLTPPHGVGEPRNILSRTPRG